MAPLAEHESRLEPLVPIVKNRTNGNSTKGHASEEHVTSEVTAPKGSHWHFDTVQVHAGLDHETAHGQCSLPVYTSASFKFKSCKKIEAAFSIEDGPTVQTHMYSRYSNVS